MKRIRILALALLMGSAGGQCLLGQATTQVRLLLDAESARPGDTVTAAVELKMQPDWHVYWRNSGDSGLPTEIQWKLPEGISAGAIQWPVPEKHTDATLVTYVYHDRVLLLVPLALDSGISPGPKTIQGDVSWLECKVACIQGAMPLQARLMVGSEAKPSEHRSLIEEWRKRLPTLEVPSPAIARWSEKAEGDSREFLIEWKNPRGSGKFDFFPYTDPNFELSGGTETLSSGRIQKTLTKYGDEWPKELKGVLVANANDSGPAQGYETTLNLESPDGAGTIGDASQKPPFANESLPPTRSEKSIALMFVFAFIGGLILNIMPCVLPIIALKILGFVNQSKEEPRRIRGLGLVFAGGVLVSFLVLAGLVIAVQQVRPASWGMQFQNPYFLVGMTVLITLVALNLFGLFEITLGGSAVGAASTLAAKEGKSGAFFNGVLATALATPCTAPFLGVALGFAFAQPAPIIVLLFLTIGLGLAAPYVALSWRPEWLRFLPKPGPWMQKFKVAMGFPMLATALWLFYLTSSHFGRAGILWIGLFLVVLATTAWVWGEFVQRGRNHQGWAVAVAAVLLLTGYLYTLEGKLNWRSDQARTDAAGALRHRPDGINWQPWSLAAVQEARAAGRTVLVDFTADWCLTCQVNKETSLEIPSVQEKLEKIQAVALLGDHTRSNPAITEELKRYDRAGVPLVLVYPPNPQEPPIVLPEVLTPGIVLDALDRAAETPSIAARSGSARAN